MHESSKRSHTRGESGEKLRERNHERVNETLNFYWERQGKGSMGLNEIGEKEMCGAH